MALAWLKATHQAWYTYTSLLWPTSTGPDQKRAI